MRNVDSFKAFLILATVLANLIGSVTVLLGLIAGWMSPWAAAAVLCTGFGLLGLVAMLVYGRPSGRLVVWQCSALGCVVVSSWVLTAAGMDTPGYSWLIVSTGASVILAGRIIKHCVAEWSDLVSADAR